MIRARIYQPDDFARLVERTTGFAVQHSGNLPVAHAVQQLECDDGVAGLTLRHPRGNLIFARVTFSERLAYRFDLRLPDLAAVALHQLGFCEVANIPRPFRRSVRTAILPPAVVAARCAPLP